MDWIYEGTLNKKGAQLFNVHRLTLEHLDEILHVQMQVVQELNSKETLQPLTREDYQYILAGQGLMIGVFVENKLIAFRALLVPAIDEEHLGRDFGLSESEIPTVIYQEISNVLPDYRGNKLQQTLALLIMKELGKLGGQFRYVCCTVAPFNIPSLKDKFAQGMQIAALKEKYGGSLRYIFVKDLEEAKAPAWQEIIPIKMSDIKAQKAKLTHGWKGFKMVEQEGTLLVYYGR